MQKLFYLLILFLTIKSDAQRQMEYLDRGVVAVRNNEGNVFVSWRLLATEPQAIAFNIYRIVENGKPEKLNKTAIADVTHFIDAKADSSKSNSYFIKSIEKGKEGVASKSFKLKPGNAPYLSIALQTPPGYSPNDGSV